MIRVEALLFLCMGLMVTASAATWYVDDSAAPGGTGVSWELAFTDIQPAVDAASAAGGGEVWVAAGEYASAAAAVVTMASNVHIYGGFDGTESAREARLWKTNVTTINGQDSRRCVVGANAATLDGFTVTHGYLLGHGGGMLNDGVSPLVENCHFDQNAVTGSGLAGGRGAGMYNVNGAATVVRNCEFSWNTTPDGGAALYNHMAAPVISNCIFHDNTADTDGVGYSGGAVFNSESPAIITNCLFYRNSAYTGGGMGTYKSAAVVTNCTFTRNTATYSEGPAGGGVFNAASVPADPHSTYTNCIFWANYQAEKDFADSGTTSAVTYCDVQYGWAGTGNRSVNPRFVNAPADNFHLLSTSQCINAGDDSAVTATGDLDGNARKVSVVDLGCYEYFVINVTQVSPLANATNVAAGTVVTARIDTHLNGFANSKRVFSLHSGMSPYLNGANVALSYDGANPYVLSLTHVEPFHPGERIVAEVFSVDYPVLWSAWEFRAAVSPLSIGIFVDFGQSIESLSTNAVALADLDNDGDLDGFVANGAGADTVFVNDGLGAFSASDQILAGGESRDVALGDLNGDCSLDVIVVGSYTDTTTWFNNGSGGLTYHQGFANEDNRAVELADIDGDGDLDAVIGISGRPCALYLNNGGTFSDSGQEIGTWAPTNDIAMGDLDGDGSPDLFRVNNMVGNEVMLNGRDGAFDNSGQTLEGPNTYAVALGDVDGDHDLDALLATETGNVVWTNDGTGFFTDSGQVLSATAGTDIELGDVNGDGALDAVIMRGSSPAMVWLNNGIGQFTQSDTWTLAANSRAVALGDVNGDGALDAFIGNYDAANSIWINEQEPAVSTMPATMIEGDSAMLNGEVTTIGAPVVHERGFYYATDVIDPLDLSSAVKATLSPDPSGTGPYSVPVTSLAAGTDYHFRAYASNGVATVLGEDLAFTTKLLPIITWDAPAPIVYGDLLGSAHLNASANVPGAFTYTPPAGTMLTGGIHALQVDFVPNDTAHYGTATASVNIQVNKAVAQVNLNGLAHTYNGGPMMAAATTNPPGLAVAFTYDGQPNPPVNAGSYAVIGIVQDINYEGQASGTLTIDKAIATISLHNLTQVYDGQPKEVLATTNPSGLTVVITYNDQNDPPVEIGSYAVTATIQDPNYEGQNIGTLTINQGVPAANALGLALLMMLVALSGIRAMHIRKA